MDASTDIETTRYEHRDGADASCEAVVLFDGVCNLCNGWVRFVVKRDPKGVFCFAPLQSKFAERTLPDVDKTDGFDTIILLENGRISVRSTAVLRILRRLRLPWSVLSIFLLVPNPIRDAVYDFVSRKRYRWFGRREKCMVPGPEIEHRFVD